MTNTLRTETLAGNAVAEHSCDGFDCYPCLKADQDAAAARTVTVAAKKFAAKKVKRQSATASARPVVLQNITQVAGDVPPAQRCYEFTGSNKLPLRVIISQDGTALLKTAEHLTETTAEVAQNIVNTLTTQVARHENQMTGGEVKSFTEAPAPTPLQRPLEGVGPAHLSEATVAKGFILAGNAYFTVRSQKTGTRYTYRVNRAKCSRCGKLDCSCWANPTYFVALLTGPDNTGDYTYLGMLRDGQFKATRATGAQAAGKPFAAFRYVWERLALGQTPKDVEIWHEGRCGRCGRKLTVPESVERGIGPECAAKGGF